MVWDSILSMRRTSSRKLMLNTPVMSRVKAPAMWELLKDKAGLTDADLDAKVQEIDMRDGRLDGQDLTQTVLLTCRQCGRTILSGQSQCSWCGAQAEGGPFTHAR